MQVDFIIFKFNNYQLIIISNKFLKIKVTHCAPAPQLVFGINSGLIPVALDSRGNTIGGDINAGSNVISGTVESGTNSFGGTVQTGNSDILVGLLELLNSKFNPKTTANTPPTTTGTTTGSTGSTTSTTSTTTAKTESTTESTGWTTTTQPPFSGNFESSFGEKVKAELLKL